MKRPAAAAGAAVIGSAAAANLLVVRPWQLRWGATDEERDATLAGDDLIPNPDLIATRAITVHATADQVWPWIAQLGQGRALVLRGGVPMGAVPSPYDTTWAFVLGEQPDGTTRLLVRERYAYTQRWAPLLVEPVAGGRFRDDATDTPRDQGSCRTG